MVYNVEENGRTYAVYDRKGTLVFRQYFQLAGEAEQAESLFPNDRRELERQRDFNALVFNVLGRKHYCAPVRSQVGNRVLDMGTGIGDWAMAFGDHDPTSVVIGIDITPVQPVWTAPTVAFQLHDIEDEWTFTETFQFTFGRQLSGCIEDWGNLIRQCHEEVYANDSKGTSGLIISRNLASGGWLELQEMDLEYYAQDDSIKPGSHIVRLHELLSAGLAQLGRSLPVADNLEELLRVQGFTNIKHHRFPVALGPWPKDSRMVRSLLIQSIALILCGTKKTIGWYRREEFENGLEALVLKPLMKGLKWSREEVEGFLFEVRQDIRISGVHPLSNL